MAQRSNRSVSLRHTPRLYTVAARLSHPQQCGWFGSPSAVRDLLRVRTRALRERRGVQRSFAGILPERIAP